VAIRSTHLVVLVAILLFESTLVVSAAAEPCAFLRRTHAHLRLQWGFRSGFRPANLRPSLSYGRTWSSFQASKLTRSVSALGRSVSMKQVT
jgi:hypothetical protein